MNPREPDLRPIRKTTTSDENMSAVLFVSDDVYMMMKFRLRRGLRKWPLGSHSEIETHEGIAKIVNLELQRVSVEVIADGAAPRLSELTDGEKSSKMRYWIWQIGRLREEC